MTPNHITVDLTHARITIDGEVSNIHIRAREKDSADIMTLVVFSGSLGIEHDQGNRRGSPIENFSDVDVDTRFVAALCRFAGFHIEGGDIEEFESSPKVRNFVVMRRYL